ncbi:MAG TPA: YraN family protein [Desulfobulbus sp.]|nr:YraN family protein [Desulfobulbus sp.]
MAGEKKNTMPLGRRGEELAARHLEQQGYRILARNYRRRFGEIDIIARHRGQLVFIEVKTRLSTRYGSPFAAVDRRKQHQLVRVATDYIARHHLEDEVARFDVVAVTRDRDGRTRVDVLEDAFHPDY